MTGHTPINLMGKIAELAEALGVENIKALPGVWLYRFGPWILGANGHDYPTNATFAVTVEEPFDETKPYSVCGDIPPFTVAVWKDGWPVGMFNAFDGEWVTGRGVRVEQFLLDLEAEIERVGAARSASSPTPFSAALPSGFSWQSWG